MLRKLFQKIGKEGTLKDPFYEISNLDSKTYL